MPRLVRLTHNGPIKVEPPLEKPLFICACGLSQKYPICDGSHKACKQTEPDPNALYIYDADRKRITDIRSDLPPGLDVDPGAFI